MDSVKIKEYNSSIEADLDKQILEQNGIIAEILNENISNIYPPVSMFDPVTLVVLEDNVDKVRELLNIEG